MSGVTITTYTMIAFGGKRSEESARVMDQIRSREWGLLLMDEVHVVPAQMFRKVCMQVFWLIGHLVAVAVIATCDVQEGHACTPHTSPWSCMHPTYVPLQP